MFHSSIMNNKINRLHERCMRLIHGDKMSSFEELLQQDKCISIHSRNLQMLATEMFKVHRSISPPILSEFFCRRDISYNFCRAKSKICFSWSESISYLDPKIWDIVPLKLKDLTSMKAFKNGIENGNQEIVLAGYVNNTYQI